MSQVQTDIHRLIIRELLLPNFRGFTVKYSQIARVLQTDISVCQPILNIPKANSPLPPAPQENKFKAIWDTGATGTVINKEVAEACGVQPIDMAKVYTADNNEGSFQNVYLVSIYLPNGVVFPQVRVTEGKINGCDVLIGMDIISKGDFAVSNFQGITTFSFRLPSIEHIDFNPNIKPVQKKELISLRRDPNKKHKRFKKR